MQFKTHINKLVRIQTSENRDIKKGVLLDRNERVENFDEGTYKKILKSISRYSQLTQHQIFKICTSFYPKHLR